MKSVSIQLPNSKRRRVIKSWQEFNPVIVYWVASKIVSVYGSDRRIKAQEWNEFRSECRYQTDAIMPEEVPSQASMEGWMLNELEVDKMLHPKKYERIMKKWC